MSERRRIKQADILESRLADEASRLRKEARGTPAGVKRDGLLRRARHCETAAQMSEWLRPKEVNPPK